MWHRMGLIFTLAISVAGCSQKLVKVPAFGGSEVRFQFDSDRVLPRSDATLRQGLAYLKNHPRSILILEGHTDDIGSEDYNRDLGDRRARAVKAYLLANGINPERLVIVSYGEAKVGATTSASRVVLLKDASRR